MEEAEAPPRHLSRRDARASGVLPEDALYEILLRLPADDVCRLRAVSRRWRSLLSEPHFIAAHAARHPSPPLVVVGYEATDRNGRVLCDIVDLSGRVVKRVHATGDDDVETNWWVMCSTQLDLLCVTKGTGMSCQLLNPATGAVHDLPDGLAAEHAAHVQDLSDCSASTVFGLVPSTGEYKVIRMIEDYYQSYHNRKLYEIFTLNGSPVEGRWRAGQAPPYDVQLFCLDEGVVLNGIVYFWLMSSDHWNNYGTRRGFVGSFDLETEMWRPIIRKPRCHYESWYDFEIAALSGHLVLCCRKPFFSMASPAMASERLSQGFVGQAT